MSAQLIYDIAPLGSFIRYSDSTPRPPERFRKRRAAWESNNNGGRLIRKTPASRTESYSLPASITLHKGDFTSGSVILVVVQQTSSVTSALKFTVAERPAIGSVRIFDRPGESGELVHVAATRVEAETWLKQHGYPNAVLDEVTADVAAADAVEGRAA